MPWALPVAWHAAATSVAETLIIATPNLAAPLLGSTPFTALPESDRPWGRPPCCLPLLVVACQGAVEQNTNLLCTSQTAEMGTKPIRLDFSLCKALFYGFPCVWPVQP